MRLIVFGVNAGAGCCRWKIESLQRQGEQLCLCLIDSTALAPVFSLRPVTSPLMSTRPLL